MKTSDVGVVIFLIGIAVCIGAFFSGDFETGFMVFLVGVIIFALGGAISGFAGRSEAENAKSEEREKARQRNAELVLEQQKEITELSVKYGDVTKEIKNVGRWKNSNIVVFEQSSTIIICKKPYKFDDILNFEVYNDSQVVYSGTTATTSTKTGSMLGRAVVGGLLLGGAGAIIGGTTGKKETITEGQTATTKHNYDVVLTLNSLSEPTLKVNFADNQNGVQEFASILSIILQRRNSQA